MSRALDLVAFTKRRLPTLEDMQRHAGAIPRRAEAGPFLTGTRTYVQLSAAVIAFKRRHAPGGDAGEYWSLKRSQDALKRKTEFFPDNRAMALQDVDMGELKHGPQDLRPMPAGMYEKRFPGLDGDGFDWDNVLQERWYGPGTGRGRITEFSAKAKNRMKQRFGTLDWKPLFPDDGRLPALMTLTMPGERWAECAPTPRDFAKMWQLFNLRFREAWGEPLVGGWKLEFQRRGAPHIHVIMLPPTGLSKGRPHADWKNVARHKRHQLQWRQGEDGRELVSRNAGGLAFEQWLSLAWAKLVAVDKLEGLSPEGRTSHWLFHRHVGAGTNVSSSTIQRYADPRRIASYFDKHGVYKAKDYQNQMCEEWRSAVLSGEGGMRFWGWWGLTVTTVEVELDERPRKFMTSRKLEFGPVPGAVDGRGIIGD